MTKIIQKNLQKLNFQLTTSAILISFVLLTGVLSQAAEPALDVSASFDISRDGAGKTFFELMNNQGGIKKALDQDYVESVIVADVETFLEKSKNFDHIRELEGKLKGGRAGLIKLIKSLEGQEIPVPDMYSKVMSSLTRNNLLSGSSRVAGALVPVIAIASGKGVMVRIDEENYVYNYGYAVGSGGEDLVADETNRKTGRSYGASVERNAYDPTDNDYLRALSSYIASSSDKEVENFYRAVFEILIKNDTSRVSSLKAAGQTVMADFLAIYMAELDRHLMTGLKKYEWENALTEITMLAAYASSEEGVTLDPRGGADNTNDRQWVASSELRSKDRLLGFFGVGTDGSGLDGRNKSRRHALSRKIVSEQRKVDRDLVEKIESLIGVSSNRDVDVYDEIMETLNNYRTQDRVRRNGDKLIDAVVEFVMSTRTHAAHMDVLTDQ